MKKWILLFFCTISSEVWSEFLYLGRSQEGLLMGDAYTAVAEDESALFYNPAALGRHQGLSFSGLSPKAHANDLIDVNLSIDDLRADFNNTLFKDLPEGPAEMADKIIGVPLHAQTGINPTIKMQQFALTLFGSSKFYIELENRINPELFLDYRTDYGIIMGHAFTFGNQRPFAKAPKFSIGLAVKKIYRQGLQNRFALTSPKLLDIIGKSVNSRELKHRLGYSKGKGHGFDTGFEFNHYTGRNSRFTFGVSLLDIGDTKIKRLEGIRHLPEQEMSVNFGTSWNQKFGLFDYTLAADYSNARDPYTPNLSKLKLGLRTRIPLLDIYWGLNGGHFSWGVGFDLFSLRVQVGFYGVEIGHDVKERKAERFLVSLDILNL